MFLSWLFLIELSESETPRYMFIDQDLPGRKLGFR